MRILVTSASGANGDGYGAVLAFGPDGVSAGRFSADPWVADPRGMCISPDGRHVYVNSGSDRILALDAEGRVVRDTGYLAGLNAGGGNLGPDGRYHVGLRSARTIASFPADLQGGSEPVLRSGIVPFPRGFAYGRDGRLYLASGIGPDGQGENTIVVFDASGELLTARMTSDRALSPLDLIVGPNGNIIVSSEFPFGRPDAVATLREYDSRSGALVRVFSVDPGISFQRPRGLRFGPDGRLYCVTRDNVMAFDFDDGRCLGPLVKMPGLNGQAIVFFP
jgi:DNA-binding beta-propeller fold protein YncE